MNRKIIKGESINIDVFLNYRNVKSDASFGKKGQPNSMMLKELVSGKSIEEYNSSELNTLYGYPNDSLTARLIDGSSQFEIQKTQGKRVGLIESIMYSLAAPSPEIPYNGKYDARLMRTEPLEKMSDEKLMQIAFLPFTFSKYGKAIQEHFSLINRQSGTDLKLKIDKWYNDNTNKDLIINFIKEKLYNAYANRINIGQEIIVPQNLLEKLNFSNSMTNKSEWIAIGGIQYLSLKGYLLYEKWGVKSWDSQGKIIESPTIIHVQLDFLLGDWFGVDEGDVISKGLAAQIGRRELAALWVLQHQRGYRPFICFYEYSEILKFTFNITY
jgi:hypothetical protein